MRLLLDSHVLLWWLAADRSLSREVKQLIAVEPWVGVSAATVWEISIKRALGKLEAPEDLVEAVNENDFAALAVTLHHAEAAGALPRLHDDPFDRMLVAQAHAEGLTIVTRDSRIAAYGVPTLPA
jgi:PIN domain nuclease of toxin-antitoxin system